ncbi:hypothetical protein LG324_13010 [Phycicoccus jejuensis]|uniref:hypothetical protein n=1 Tax=Phycicoccus jejuensis TaxID=367299 RepID=UPI00384AFE6F
MAGVSLGVRKAALALIAAGLLLSACTDTAGTDQTPPPSTQGSSATPSSASPTPSESASTLDKDAQAAADAVENWVAVVDRFGANRDLDLSKLYQYARDDALNQTYSDLTAYREKGWTQTGKFSLEVLSSSKNKSGDWVVMVCQDGSQVDVVDKSGKSVRNPDAAERVKFRYTVQKDGSTLYVTGRKAIETC